MGFERIHLKAGESKQIELTVNPRDMQLLNAQNKWVIEPGMFHVMVGASSEDIRLKGQFEAIN